MPFIPSNAHSADDLNVEFKRAYQQSPELVLPPGTWSIDVATFANLGVDCSGPALDIEVSLTVLVTQQGNRQGKGVQARSLRLAPL